MIIALLHIVDIAGWRLDSYKPFHFLCGIPALCSHSPQTFYLADVLRGLYYSEYAFWKYHWQPAG